MNAGDIDEPVHESAPLAFRTAARLCRLNPETGETCAWYHGFRQYLRVLGLAITPAHHAEFLRDAFATVARPGGRLRVLVSGAIDYSMLAHVLWASREHGATADVTVVDLCETPLFLNQWYATRTGIAVETFRSDILGYAPGDGFDVICTNAFFGQFPPERRRELMLKWNALLRRGGKVFTVTPFRPGSGTGRIGFTQQQARELRDAVLHAARERADAIDMKPEALAHHADRFAARMQVYPVRSLDEIADLVGQGGLAIERLESMPVEPDAHAGLSGPTVSRSASYAAVIANRP